MVHPPPCFDYFSLGKVTGRAFILSCCIQIWNSWAIFCYSPIWSPAAPVSRLHCLALLLLVARTSCQNDSGEGAVWGWGGQSARWCLVTTGCMMVGWGGFYTVSLNWYLQIRAAHLVCVPFLHASFQQIFCTSLLLEKLKRGDRANRAGAVV